MAAEVIRRGPEEGAEAFHGIGAVKLSCDDALRGTLPARATRRAENLGGMEAWPESGDGGRPSSVSGYAGPESGAEGCFLEMATVTAPLLTSSPFELLQRA